MGRHGECNEGRRRERDKIEGVELDEGREGRRENNWKEIREDDVMRRMIVI